MPATDKVSLPGRPVLRERRKQVSYAESDAESDSSGSANVSGSDDSDQYEYDEDSKSDNANSHEPENPLALLAKLKARRRKRTLQLAAPSSKKQKIKRVITPRSIKRLNAVNTITPLKSRAVDLSRPMTNFERARERLHVSAVPDSLPCREEEFAEIYELLRNDIEGGTGTCIYISGVPGTGKTATVHEVIRHLQHDAENEELPPFDFVEINGMKVTDPNQAYSILWECLNKQSTNDRPKRVTSAHALQLLESRFSSKNANQRTTVVLMDELDLMVTKKQTVMYNFFEWPNRPDSRLIVVAIANTMDLPERILTNKVSSRMGLRRINFQPYTYEQLGEIVRSRLEGIDAFDLEAISYAARKVSAVSGDARRALDICRRAVEIVEERQGAKSHVTIHIITEAIKEMLSSPSVAFIQSCSLHQKLFLVSVLHCIRRTGLGDVEFGDVVLAHMQTCKWHHIEAPMTSDLMRVCESLGQARALVIEDGRMDLSMRMSLNLLEQDIIVACKDDRIVGRLLANIS